MSAEKCKAKVVPNTRFGAFYIHRCTRKAVRDGYCRQHHPEAVAERERKSSERHEEKIAASPQAKLRKEVERLSAEVSRLADTAHYANGTAELALQHRDAAERHAEALRGALTNIVQAETLDYARSIARTALDLKSLTPDFDCVSGSQKHTAETARD